MKGLEPGVELLEWHEKDVDGYYTVRLAVNGVRTGRFSFPASHLDGFLDEAALGQWLSRQAHTMLQRYGRDGLLPEASDSRLMRDVA